MPETENPYEPAASISRMADAPRSSTMLGRPTVILVAVFFCVLVAVVAGEILSLIALLPPLNRPLGLNGEFSGLILIGMPMLVGGCGAVAGLSVGVLYPRPSTRWVSMLLVLLLSMACWGFANPSPREAVGIFSTIGIMFIATIIGIVVSHRTIVMVESRRALFALPGKTNEVRSAGRVVTAIACGMALVSLLCDGLLWQSMARNEDSGHEFELVGAFLLGMLAVTLNIYVGAAYLHRRRAASIAGLASLGGFLAVVTQWYLQLGR